jgi:hypothetical protein
MPEIGLWKVIPQSIRIENDLGNHAVLPLVFKKGPNLLHGPILVVVGITDGDEARIPIPLMRV